MLTQDQVREIFEATWDKAKGFVRDGTLIEKKGKLPEFYPGYNDTVRTAREIAVHIEPGVFAEHLIRERSPNQTEQEFTYVQKNAKQVTLPVWQDFENTIRRALSPTNWEIKLEAENEAASDLHEYITEGITEYDSVTNFVNYLLPKLKAKDPMGLLVVTPGEVPVTENEAGELVIDGTQPFRPQIAYIEGERVWAYKAGQYYLYLSNERSAVEYSGKMQERGMVFYLVDDTLFWRIAQFGKAIDYTFTVEEYIQHGVGYPPADHLKGIPEYVQGSIVWKSIFLPAKDVLDLAYLDAQNLMVIKNACVYPHKVMVGDECDFTAEDGTRCMDGKFTRYDVLNPDAPGMVSTCPKCHGSGSKSRMSPMGVLLIRPNSGLTGAGNEMTAQQSLYFVEPSTANTQFLSDQVDRNIAQARAILHLDSEVAQAGGAQPETATQGGLRNRAMIAFIKPIADQMLNTVEFLVDAIAKMRYPGQDNLFTMMRPSVIDLRTEADLLADIEAARKAEMPPAVVADLVWKYIGTRYNTAPDALAAFEVIGAADRLYGMTAQQVQLEATAKRVEPWEVVLHYSALTLLDDIRRADPGFDALELDAKVEALKNAAKALAPIAAPAASPAANLLANAIAQ